MYKHGIALPYILFCTLIILNGCGINPNVRVNELSNDTISYDETIHINNCGGKADSEQTVSHSFATTIEGGAEISAGYQSIVEGSVSAKYSQYRSVSKSQKLIAAPSTNMEFILRWSEDVHAGNVTVNGTTDKYEVRVPVTVEQVSSQDLGCALKSTICPYVGVNDYQTFVNLIRAEETAVLTKNINTIAEIYENKAIRVDVPTNNIDTDVVQAYQKGFYEMTFLELEHFDFNLIKKTSDTAWFSVSARDTIRFLSTGDTSTYDNSIAHIIFRKDNSGCWKISEFRFNAENEVFP